MFKEEFPASSLGYSSVLKLLHDLPGDVCDITPFGESGDWLVSKKKKKGSQEGSKDGVLF